MRSSFVLRPSSLLTTICAAAALVGCAGGKTAVNGLCTNGDDCIDGICHLGICLAKTPLPKGDTCGGAGECKSVNCVGGVCVAGARPDGVVCLYADECQSNVCENTYCGGVVPDGGLVSDAGPGGDGGGTGDGAPSEDGGSTTPAGQICSTDNWCWQHPLPQGLHLEAVWVAGAKDVFAVGSLGTILRFDGKSWSKHNSGTDVTLRGIWGTGPSDVFAVGDGGTILHFDGSGWKAMDSGDENDLYGVWGASGNNVFVVGPNGLLHFDGAVWSVSNASVVGYAIWGQWPEAMFVAGAQGYIWRYDGTKWNNGRYSSYEYMHNQSGIWGVDSDTAYVVGARYVFRHSRVDTSTKWELVREAKQSLHAIWGSGPDDLFAVGDGGTILHWDGTLWTAQPAPINENLLGVWGEGASEVYAVGRLGTVLRYDGSTWSALSTRVTEIHEQVNTLWGTGASNVLAGGSRGSLLRYDGKGWTSFHKVPPKGSSTPVVADIWGSGPDDVYIAARNGENQLLRYDGKGWSGIDVRASGNYNAVWGSGKADVYAGGSAGKMAHYNGVAWTELDFYFGTINDIWGSGPDDIFAVGDSGGIYHWDGSEWKKQSSTTTVRLRAVWGSSGSDVYAAGDQVILRYDGKAWVELVSGSSTPRIYDIWGTAADNLYFAGTNPNSPGSSLLHFDGKKWTPQVVDILDGLNAVWGSGPKDVFVARDGILHRGQ